MHTDEELINMIAEMLDSLWKVSNILNEETVNKLFPDNDNLFEKYLNYNFNFLAWWNFCLDKADREKMIVWIVQNT